MTQGTVSWGGQATNTGFPAYASLVAPDGTLTNIDLSSFSNSSVQSVAINQNRLALIGGTTPAGFLAISVSPSGAVSTLPVPIVPGSSISKVAINDNNYGVITGGISSTIGYAAIVKPDATVVELTLPNNLIVVAADINNSQVALIGGTGTNPPSDPCYVAFVYEDGSVKEITMPLDRVSIFSASINEAGVGLLGGEDALNGAQYSCIIAPNGSVTSFQGSLQLASLYSVAINDLINPTFFGTSSFSQGSLALSSQVLNNHLIELKSPSTTAEATALLVDASKTPSVNNSGACSPIIQNHNYTLWAAPVFFNSYQDPQNGWPKVTNWVGGGMLGFDYTGYENATLGGGFAYAFDRTN